MLPKTKGCLQVSTPEFNGVFFNLKKEEEMALFCLEGIRGERSHGRIILFYIGSINETMQMDQFISKIETPAPEEKGLDWWAELQADLHLLLYHVVNGGEIQIRPSQSCSIS